MHIYSRSLYNTLIIVAMMVFSAFCEAAKIGVAWVGKAGMATQVCAGFESEIKNQIPDAQIEYKKEMATIDDLATLVAGWEKEKTAMVILRSNGAQWLAKNPPKIPTFIGGCSNPKELGVIKNLDKPEGNITGVTYYLPANKQFITFKAMLPNISSIVLLIEKGHPSAEIDINETEAACKANGFSFISVQCATVDDAINAIKSNASEKNVFIMGNQALLIDNAAKIVAQAGKIPVLSYSSKAVENGALGGFSADDIKLGKMLAVSVSDVVKNGKPVSSVSVKVDPQPQLILNTTSIQKTGIVIPMNIMSIAKKVQ